MEEKRRIEQELRILESLKSLAQAHEEVSTTRIRLARGSVLATRDFLMSLATVFVNVKSAYKKHLQELVEKNKQNNTFSAPFFPEKNKRQVFVLLSANNKLYGDIISKVFQLFKEECEKNDVDIIIIGKLGKELYDASSLKKTYQYFSISDNEQNMDDVKELLDIILHYESVTVFYGQFVNVVTQVAVSTNISGDSSLGEIQSEGKTKEYDFLFEPSLEKVFDFFQSQTFYSLFKQTIHEAELARYGSRIKAMEIAIEGLNKDISTLGFAQRRVKNLIANKKQLERIAGISLWKSKRKIL